MKQAIVPVIKSFSTSSQDTRCLEVWFTVPVDAETRTWLLEAINEKALRASLQPTTPTAEKKPWVEGEPSECDGSAWDRLPPLVTAIDDDPSADERWNAGCDFAMIQLCKALGVDPKSVSWDAATETLDGDVQAVIGNILRAKFGEDWGPASLSAADHERELANLIARYYRQEIGCSMQQAEHWAKENFPLAVHHRVRKADAYYQVVALCERFADWNENPFDTMREALKRGLIKPAGTYPPTAEIHAYRHPVFVVEKLKTASKAAGGPA